MPRDDPTSLIHPRVRAAPHSGRSNDKKLTAWIVGVRTAQLPYLHAFANGLELDRAAVNAGLTLPHHNGRTEGVNTRTKRITRQMHGRAGFDLLRHRILLH
ncbi:transposase [Streptomyces sp. NPDC090022]|uniref:transposase n=1 Tax=Streptomyces sp. NPDC090022 TaxID=3365920 RepID=UPI00380CF7D4